MTASVFALALLLDRLLGEPRRWHPLVGFGRVAARLEHRLNGPEAGRAKGLLAAALLLAPPVLLVALASALPFVGPLVEVLVLYLAIGWRSLAEHAQQVVDALQQDDLNLARQRVGLLVSRDTSTMDETAVSRAGVESVLENGSDAVFGALFWFLIGGAPGVVLYRLANTLDAMWGYRTPRFLHFGWTAARFDDLLNWVPARLTALSYALLGQLSTALHCWRTQAPAWDSPNAGPVMAAGAGALGLTLGGPAIYHGQLEQRPSLGEGPPPKGEDILRAIALVRRGVWLWLVLAVLIAGGHYLA